MTHNNLGYNPMLTFATSVEYNLHVSEYLTEYIGTGLVLLVVAPTGIDRGERTRTRGTRGDAHPNSRDVHASVSRPGYGFPTTINPGVAHLRGNNCSFLIPFRARQHLYVVDHLPSTQIVATIRDIGSLIGCPGCSLTFCSMQ